RHGGGAPCGWSQGCDRASGQGPHSYERVDKDAGWRVGGDLVLDPAVCQARPVREGKMMYCTSREMRPPQRVHALRFSAQVCFLYCGSGQTPGWPVSTSICVTTASS